MSPNTTTSSTRSSSTLELRRHLDGVRRQAMLLSTSRGLLKLVTAVVAFCAIAVLADWVFEIPRTGRMAVVAAGGIGFLALLFWWLFRPLARNPDLEGAALLVEKAHPDFNSRLISALQFEKASSTDEFQAAMMEQTIADAARISDKAAFSRAVSFKPLWKIFWIALASVLLFGAWIAVKKPVSYPLLARLFLSDVGLPRKTRIISITGHVKVGLGDPLTIQASVEGIIPDIGILFLETPEKRVQELPLDREPETAKFERRLETVGQSMVYWVKLNDSKSERFNITVQERPLVTSIKGQVEPPAYAKMVRTNVSLIDLNPLLGSRLYFELESNKELHSGQAVLAGLNQKIPIQVSTSNRRQAQVMIPVNNTNLTGFSVELLDTQQMHSTNSPVYAIKVRADLGPQISIRYPDRKEELLTKTARLSVLYEVHDDFGIDESTFHYRIIAAPGAKGRENMVPIARHAGQRGLTNRHEFALSSVTSLRDGMLVEYWFSAKDNNVVSGPGRGQSEVYVVKVVSPEEKRRDLMHRVSDSLGGLNDLASEQEKLNENLGTVLRPKNSNE